MSENKPQDSAAMPPASDSYAVEPKVIERAFREVIESANEASRTHAMNYSGLITALLTKGVISAEELEAGRQQAKPLVDEHFGPTPEQKRSEELVKLLSALGRKA